MIKGIVQLVIIILCFFGYGLNVGKLIGSDFKEPYKAEIIRSVGIFVPIVGIPVGYMDIGK